MIVVGAGSGRYGIGCSRPPARIAESAGSCGDTVPELPGTLTWGDLISAAPVSPVVSLDTLTRHLAARRPPGPSISTGELPPPERLNAAVESYIQGYFLGEDENRRAVSSIVGSLAGEAGRGFLVNGLHGSGKSHLLAVLALLASRPEAWISFAASYPSYAAVASRFGAPSTTTPPAAFRRQDISSNGTHAEPLQAADTSPGPLLVVPVSLDAHRASREDLEDIVFAAAELALEDHEEGQSSRLSAASFALDLAETRLLPLYQERFARWLRERFGAIPIGTGDGTQEGAGDELEDGIEDGIEEWNALKARDPAGAAGLAAEFSRESKIPLEWHEPRRERLRRLLEIARRCGRRGVLILLDELSLYLSGKSREQFYGDVSFLQFLGQQSAYFPLWIVGAVQRGIEETGDIDVETLRKLKDRYTWDLSLSMAQIRPVLGQRLLRRKNPAAFAAFIHALGQRRYGSVGNETAGRVSLTPGELADIYPLDPLALECLVEMSGRFFSRTRSVVEFVQRAVRSGGSRAADDLVGPDEVFARFWPGLAELPELGPAAAAYQHYSQNIQQTVPEDAGYALRLVGALAAMSLAGLRRSVREVAGSLGACGAGTDPKRPCPEGPCPEGPYPEEPPGIPGVSRARAILERLRQDDGYVDVVPGASPEEDVYFLDPAYDTARIIRRRIAVCASSIREGDCRVSEAAYAAAADQGLPLASLDRGIQVEVDWLTARHVVAAARRDLSKWSSDDAAAEMSWLSDPRQNETLRLFVAELSYPQAQRDRFLQALRQAPEGRWRGAIVAWLPRALRPDEQHALRDYAAFRLVLEDPTLRLSKIGRQVLERLREEQPDRDRRTREVVRSAYFEGELVGAEGTIAGLAELCRHSTRLETVALLAAGRVFPSLFPDYLSVAPRRPAAGENLSALLDHFVIPGSAVVPPGCPLEGLLRDIAAPLGIVSVRNGRSVACLPPPALLDLVLACVPEGEAPDWRMIASRLSRSSFGLTAGQVDLLGAVLCKRGLLAACDRDGAVLPVHHGVLPLSRHARSIRRGDTLDEAQAGRLAAVADALEASAAPANPAGPEILWARLLALRSDLESFVDQRRLETLLPDLNGPESDERTAHWSASLELLGDLRLHLQRIDPAVNPGSGSRIFVESLDDGAVERLAALYRGWKALQQFTADEGPQLAAILRYLDHPALCVPPDSDLDRRILRFRQAARGGEGIVSRAADAVRYGNSLLQRYREHYLRWHMETFSPERFRPYRTCFNSPGWRALGQLDRLPLGDALLPAIQATVDEQAARHCSGAGLGASLLRSPVCPACRLPAGSVLTLVSPDLVRERILDAFRQKLHVLSAPRQREQLNYHRDHRVPASSPVSDVLAALLQFLERLQASELTEEDLPALDEWLDDALLREIRMALVGREPCRRSLSSLRDRLTGRELTRADATRLFAAWLDPDGTLGPDAFVLVEE